MKASLRMFGQRRPNPVGLGSLLKDLTAGNRQRRISAVDRLGARPSLPSSVLEALTRAAATDEDLAVRLACARVLEGQFPEGSRARQMAVRRGSMQSLRL